MEVNKCVICCSSLEESWNRKVDVDMVKIFYDILIHSSSRNSLISVTADNCWISISEFSYFCLSCERKVVSIADLSSDVKSIQTTIKWLVDEMKMKIIKSTSNSDFKTRNVSKVIAKSNIRDLCPATTLSDKIDCFRSLGVIDFNPDVIVIKSQWPTEPLKEDMVHMTKLKFSYFWKKTSETTKSFFCNSFTEDEIIGVKGLTKESLTLTEDQLEAHFIYKNENYKCNVCHRTLKDTNCAINHYVSIHRKIKKYKCGYCGEGYFDRRYCGVHILRDHEHDRKPRPTETFEGTKPNKLIKCIICYSELMQSDQREAQSDVFLDYCDVMNLNYHHPYFQWNSLDGISIFCTSCYGSVVALCDLDNKRKEMLKSINKVVLQIKTDILMSMSQSEQNLDACKTICSVRDFNTKDVADKVDCIRSAAIQEFNPYLRLFKVGNHQRLLVHRRKNSGKKAYPKNSLFTMLKDGECINLNPALAETRLPLTEEETEFYLQFDPVIQKYKCRECSTILHKKYSAENHVNKFHKQLKMFECKYCGQQYYTKIDCAYHIVRNHIKERKMDKSIAAPLPKVKLTTPNGVIDLGKQAAPRLQSDTVKSLPNGKGFGCVLCSLEFKNRSSTVKHIKSVHYSMARFQCEFCGFKKLLRCDVVYHVQRVHCDEVKKMNIVFESTSDFVAKQLLKEKKLKKPRAVDMTGVKLVERKHTDADVEEYFTASGVGYTCKHCGQMYTVRRLMVYHVESIHLGVRNCECAVCGKRFFKINQCRRHYVQKHSKTTSASTKSTLISGVTNINDFTAKQLDDISDGLNDNSMAETNFKTGESLKGSNCETQKQKSVSTWNTLFVKDSASKMFAQEDSVNDVNETNVNFVKVEAPCNFSMEFESEGVVAMATQMECNSGESEGKDQTIFQNEDSEAKGVTYYETLTLEQEQEAPKIADYWDDPLKSDGEEDYRLSQTLNKKQSKNPIPAPDKIAYVYTLIKEGDIIVLPDVEMSEVYKYFTKIGDTEFKCIKCSKILRTDIQAKRHALEFHNYLKRYQCGNCLKLYSARFHCAEHFVVKHTRHKLYQCHICENSFTSNRHLKNHVKSHLNRDFTCKVCPLKFPTNQGLNRHYTKVHKSVLQQTVE